MAAHAACRHASLPLTNSTKADEQMSVNATSVTTLRLHMGSQKAGFVSDFQGSPFGARVSCVSQFARSRTYARTPWNQTRNDNDGERIARWQQHARLGNTRCSANKTAELKTKIK